MDPSQLLRPEDIYNGKPVNAFRDFSIDNNDPVKSRVKNTYTLMHTHQTVDFVKGKVLIYVVIPGYDLNLKQFYLKLIDSLEKMQKWLKFDHAKCTIKEALLKLNDLIDESDPDTDVPNIVHAFQTAEKIRAEHPNLDWFHLTGLIHDIGKARFL